MVFKSSWKPATLIILMTTSLALTGCFETGKSEGRALVLINGSMLKGIIGHADVAIFNSQGGLMWQGASDAQGNYSAEYSTSLKQLVTVVVTVTNESRLQCDAIRCIAPLSAKSYDFGEFMPGSEFGSLRFKSSVYLDPANGTSNGTTAVREAKEQVNGFSTLVIDVVGSQLDDSLSNAQYQQIIIAGCEVVAAALALEMENMINILDLPLPNIAEQGSLDNASTQEATLGLINAGLGANMAQLAQFSNAIRDFALSPDNPATQTTLTDIQQDYLANAQALIDPDSGRVQVDDETVRENINTSLEDSIDFDQLEAAIDALETLSGKEINDLFASSTHLDANRDDNKPGRWWWAGAAGSSDDAWVQLDYSEGFVPLQLEIGLNPQQNNDPQQGKIQGQNEGNNWVTLGSIDTLEVIAEHIDERQVRHVRFALAGAASYQQYRFLLEPSAGAGAGQEPSAGAGAGQEPSASVRLEYLCFARTLTPDAVGIPCTNSETAINSSTSGSRLEAANIADSSAGTWWVSTLASGHAEWLVIEYHQAFVATQAALVIKKAHQGQLPTLQGSNDGQNWTLIHSINAAGYAGEFTDERGFRHIEIPLTHDEAYRHYRYHAQPSAFIWLEFFNFTL